MEIEKSSLSETELATIPAAYLHAITTQRSLPRHSENPGMMTLPN